MQDLILLTIQDMNRHDWDMPLSRPFTYQIIAFKQCLSNMSGLEFADNEKTPLNRFLALAGISCRLSAAAAACCKNR
jgi:hypothetical protein